MTASGLGFVAEADRPLDLPHAAGGRPGARGPVLLLSQTPSPVNFAMTDGYSKTHSQGRHALPVFAFDLLMG